MLKRIDAHNDHRYVLVYFRNISEMNMYSAMLDNKKYVFVIISKEINRGDFLSSKVSLKENVLFCENPKRIIFKLSIFGCLLTTDALPAEAHKQSLQIIFYCKKAGIPVIELQHGLFTYGASYHMQGHERLVSDDSLPCEPYCDCRLSFYPSKDYDVCIGYPPYSSQDAHLDETRGEYVLIMSNLHWANYTNEERFSFFHSVFRLAANHEDTLFIWKFHPGEIKFPYINGAMDKLYVMYPQVKKNLIVHHKDKILTLTSFKDLVRKSKMIISTVSTVLLDCEIYGKDTVIYNCVSSDEMVSMFKQKTCFSTYEGLESVYGAENKLETGYLHPFKAEVFDAFMEKTVIEPVDKFRALDVIMKSSYSVTM